MNAIELKNVYRNYDYTTGWLRRQKHKKEVLKDVSFTVKENEIFGLLGENGAGKTTTIKILSTLLLPTEGECKILGYDVKNDTKNIRKKINFIFGGESGLYPRLSGKDNLLYFANLYKIPHNLALQRIDFLLNLVNLHDSANKLVETYSKGMIQRMQIVKGLINDPQLILMDEPTIGLDPLGAKMLRDIIKSLKLRGKTILLTTHYMDEADELCDRIAFIKEGRIVEVNTPEYFKNKIDKVKKYEITFANHETNDFDCLNNITGIKDIKYKNNTLSINYSGPLDITNVLIDQLSTYQIINFIKKENTLEDVYFQLLGDD